MQQWVREPPRSKAGILLILLGKPLILLGILLILLGILLIRIRYFFHGLKSLKPLETLRDSKRLIETLDFRRRPLPKTLREGLDKGREEVLNLVSREMISALSDEASHRFPFGSAALPLYANPDERLGMPRNGSQCRQVPKAISRSASRSIDRTCFC
jgi:hypothetical protein